MTATIAPPATDIAFRVEARQLAAACETVARRLACAAWCYSAGGNATPMAPNLSVA